MKRISRATLILVLLVQALATAVGSQNRPPEKASVEGFVLRSGTGDPLGRAEVTLRRISDREEREIPRYLTQQDGKFSFQSLEPGQYELQVGRNGYARQIYGQRVAGGRRVVINLGPGQAMKDVTFRLVPGGIITGRVRDSGGEPITGMQVFLMKAEYTEDGKRRLTNAEGTITDDRGEYRLFWIPPGRYYLGATELLRGKRDGLGPDLIADQVFPTTFYPGGVDLHRAVAIDVFPGAEMGAMDIVLAPPATYRIRGTAVDTTTGRPPTGLQMGLSPRVAGDSLVIESEKGYTTHYESATGRFEILGVVSGDYWLAAFTLASKGDWLSAVSGAMFRPPASGQVTVNVTTSDLNDVVLTVGPGITIPVRLRIEGDREPVARNLDEIAIYLRPHGSVSLPAATDLIDADGNATLSSVFPGDYRVVVHIPESMGLYTSDAVHQRSDALNDVWKITPETAGPLNVTLSSRGGQIDGTLRDGLSQPASGLQVVLVPDQLGDRLDLYKRATTDTEGRFVFRGIAPGGYKVFAWEALEEYAYYHKDVLALYETQGVPVRIQEASKETISLRLIPALRQ